MTHVAFFRNLNQGQRGSPDSNLMRTAFIEAGAQHVRLVRSNGTVMFTAHDPGSTADSAADILVERSRWDDTHFVRELPWLLDLVHELAELDPLAQQRTEVTFFEQTADPLPLLPIEGPRCTVVRGGPGYAVTLNSVDLVSDSTPMIERALEVSATSRALSTLHRLTVF